MPRNLNATLLSALDAGDYSQPIIRGWLGVEGALGIEVQILAYKLGNMKLTAKFYRDNDEVTGFQYDTLIIERGLMISGVEYTVFSLPYTIKSFIRSYQVYQVECEFANNKSYQAAGDQDYETVITAWLSQAMVGGFTPNFREPAADWLGYQFLPTGKNIIINENMFFLNMLAQKYLIFLADNANIDQPDVFSVDDTFRQSSNDWNLTIQDSDIYDETVVIKKFRWVDENGTYYEPSTDDLPVHNLGYLESTAQNPKPSSTSFDVGYLFYPKTKITLPFHLKYLTGDRACFISDSISVLNVVEILDTKANPAWRIELSPLNFLPNTEGGALPSTIERVSNYTPLNTSAFDNILSSNDNNLQAAMDTIDDHTHLYTSLTVRPTTVIPTSLLFDQTGMSTSGFTGTIATLPGGAVLTYNVTSGNEDTIGPSATTYWSKQRLYNTTRGNYGLINANNTGTNTTTLNANVPGNWQVGDTITTLSPTVIGGGFNWVDMEIVAGDYLNRSLVGMSHAITDTGGAGAIIRFHPFQTYAGAKVIPQRTQSTQRLDTPMWYTIISNVITVSWVSTGAGTMFVQFKTQMYME